MPEQLDEKEEGIRAFLKGYFETMGCFALSS
jgi:hypothetical protein